MLMTGTNNKLKLWKTKLYLIIRQIQDMEKLYSDKKGVSKSYAKGKKSNAKTKATLGEFLQVFIILIRINYFLRRK